MTVDRYTRRVVLPFPKDANGKPLCRWCRGPLSGRRTSWCSQRCIDEYELRYDAKRQRREVKKRDKGVCALCGLDTTKFREDLQRVYREAVGSSYIHAAILAKSQECVELLLRHGMTARDVAFNSYGLKSFWEMDHILPVVEGGGGTGLENLRTLCIPCHRKETKMLAARRATKRKEQVKKDEEQTHRERLRSEPVRREEHRTRIPRRERP